jgi:hypothetical protein
MNMFRLGLCGFAASLSITAVSTADINGFNGLNDWAYNHADTAAPPQIVNSNLIQFTGGPVNRRSIWFNTPQDITAFQATFTYRATSIAASGSRQGIAFVMQNAGTTALGTGSTGYQGIATSAAVTLETDTGPGRSYSGFYTNGLIGGGSTVMTPVNAFDFRDIDVTITYNGSILSVTMVDGANTYGPQNYLVGSLSNVLGGSTAYIGFTGATFTAPVSGGGATQFLSDVTFTTIPTPGTAGLLALGSIAALRRRR